MARVARLFRPCSTDVDRVLKSQPFRPLGELQASGFALLQYPVTVVATGANDLPVQALVLAVVAAEAAWEL
ncbi:MAG: hypothetical protein ACLQKA_23395, partial [Bryobacteraceae bacterium]